MPRAGAARRSARRPEPRLPGARRDRRHGDLRARADPGAAGGARRSCGSPRSSTARRPRPATGPGASSIPAVTCPCARATASSGCAASSSSCPACAAAAGVRPRAHPRARPRPLRGRFRARHHDPRPQLPHGARGALRRCSALGMRVLVPLAARRVAPRDRRLAGRRATTSSSSCGCRRSRIDVVPLGTGAGPRRAADAGGRAARAATSSATRPVLLTRVGQAAAQEPRAAARRARALIPRERRPVLVLPGYPTPHEARAARRSARRSASRRDVRFLGWTDDADLEGLYAAARGVRVPVALRGLRAAGARGDGARRAGRLLGPRRRCPRWRATPRCCSTPTTPRAIAAAIERLLGDRDEAERLRAAGRAARRALHLGAHRASCTLASLRARARRRA